MIENVFLDNSVVSVVPPQSTSTGPLLNTEEVEVEPYGTCLQISAPCSLYHRQGAIIKTAPPKNVLDDVRNLFSYCGYKRLFDSKTQ